MKPDSFTITSFWLDWSLVPVMLIAAWLTARWAVADSKQASRSKNEAGFSIPAWAFSLPLFIASAAWLVAGMGTLIREDYWEMRVILGAFILWTLCCIIGAVLLLLIFLANKDQFGTSGVFNLVGLIILSLLMILPGLIDHDSVEVVTIIGHGWFFLLAVCVGLLLAGVILGFPYKFPRFPLGLGAFFLFGWGLSEIAFQQASFPWLVRIWKPQLGLTYLDDFKIAAWWQLVGAAKVLAGFAAAIILVLAIRRQRLKEKNN